MKLLGKISPFSSDWFYVSVVKNFIIVILAGTLGGSFVPYRSFNSFLGRRKLIMSWDSFYLFRPIQGSIMGLISYVLIRSGIYAGVPGASIADANLFVVAAGALVAGLYSDELYSKFHEVFDLLFKVKDQKGDTIEAVQKYPAIVQKIIDDSLLPENEIMVVLTKDGSTLIDDKHLHVLDSSKSYWIIKFLVGKEEIHVISDESKLIVCKYNAKE